MSESSFCRVISTFALTVALVLLALAPAAQAETILVGPDGIVCPTGTNPETGLPWAAGDTYHLVFATGSNVSDATSTDIATYHATVNTVANGSSLPGVPEATWYAIGSTSTVDAKDLFPVTDTSPIYLLDGGTMVSPTYADMWDGAIDNQIVLSENATGPVQWIWSGTNDAGNGFVAGDLDMRLGDNDEKGPVYGTTSPTNPGHWIAANVVRSRTDLLGLYGISAELTVVPEPSSFCLAAFGLLGLLGCGWRRKR